MAAAFLATHGIDLQAEMSRVQFGASPPPALSSSPSPSSLPLPPLQPLTLIRSVLLPHLSPTDHYDIHISPTTGIIAAIMPSLPPSPTPPPPPIPSPSLPTNSILPPAPAPAPTVITPTSCPTLPSLTHPHIHLDKPHLLSHPRYSHLHPTTGSFSEALSLTAQAKSLFEEDDLLQRANWLVRDSVEAGVTHMRAFVEVDSSVGMRGVRAGEVVRALWRGRCELQLCAFMQEAVFGEGEGDGDGADSDEDEEEPRAKRANRNEDTSSGRDKPPPPETNKRLLEAAALLPSIAVLGSTPYVEATPSLSRRNIDWIVDLALTHRKHLDLHLDYTLDPAAEPLVFYVLAALKARGWRRGNPGKTVCLGHCTRLTLFSRPQWERVRREVGDLPVHFVGLPTSDLFMMGRPGEGEGEHAGRDRPRGTLQVPWMVSQGFNACVGVNNVGNAFTPFGGADPLGVAGWGVGIYQVGTGTGAEVLYEAVSGRAREAIGLGGGDPRGMEEGEEDQGGPEGGESGADGAGEGEKGEKGGKEEAKSGAGYGIKVGDPADLVIYGKPLEQRTSLYRPRRSVQEIVCDAGRERVVVKGGRVVRVD